MLTFGMIDRKTGHKWEFIRNEDGTYTVKCYELNDNQEWEICYTEEGYEKEDVEDVYDVILI